MPSMPIMQVKHFSFDKNFLIISGFILDWKPFYSAFECRKLIIVTGIELVISVISQLTCNLPTVFCTLGFSSPCSFDFFFM